MNLDSALALIFGLLRTTVELAGPLLLASLVAGVLIGIVQTATQINEPSISFIAKVLSVILVMMLAGPIIAEKMLDYTRSSLRGIENVVR